MQPHKCTKHNSKQISVSYTAATIMWRLVNQFPPSLTATENFLHLITTYKGLIVTRIQKEEAGFGPHIGMHLFYGDLFGTTNNHPSHSMMQNASLTMLWCECYFSLRLRHGLMIQSPFILLRLLH